MFSTQNSDRHIPCVPCKLYFEKVLANWLIGEERSEWNKRKAAGNSARERTLLRGGKAGPSEFGGVRGLR